MNRRATFSQADVTRALKAHVAAGIPVARTEVTPDGRIVVFTVHDGAATGEPNDWDRVAS